LRDWHLAEKIEGLITLSTPFLHARRRELSALARIAGALGIFTAWLFMFKLMIYPFQRFFERYASEPNEFLHDWYITFPAFSLGTAIPFLSIPIMIGLLFVTLLGVAAMTDWFESSLALPDIQTERMLIIRGPSDEAGALLTTFHAMEMLITALWGRRGPLDRVVYFAYGQVGHLWTRVVESGFAFFIAMWVAVDLIVITLTPWVAKLVFKIDLSVLLPGGEIGMGFLYGGYRDFLGLVPTPVAVLLAVLMLPLLVLVVSMLVVGPIVIKAGLYVAAALIIAVTCTALLAVTTVPELGPCAGTIVISAEATPPGEFTVHQLSTRGAGVDSLLLHSIAYTHPEALDRISKWISGPKPALEPIIIRKPENPVQGHSLTRPHPQDRQTQ
jgi:hypothetical protein